MVKLWCHYWKVVCIFSVNSSCKFDKDVFIQAPGPGVWRDRRAVRLRVLQCNVTSDLTGVEN